MANKVSRAGEYLNLAGVDIGAILNLSGDQVIRSLFAYDGTAVQVSFANMTALEEAYLSNAPVTSISIAGATSLATLDCNGCALPEDQVDAVLAALDTMGVEAGEVDLSGGTNAIPSAAGLTSKSNLEGKGWTVTVNS